MVNCILTRLCTLALVARSQAFRAGGGGGGGGRPGTHCMRMHVNFPTFQEFHSTPGFLRVGVVTTVYYPDTYSVIYQYIA